MQSIASGVLTSQVDGHEDGQNHAHTNGCDQSSVSRAVVRGIISAEDEAGDGTTEVTLESRVSVIQGG